jgi:NitT/TauT family transport system substrate-binding protein
MQRPVPRLLLASAILALMGPLAAARAEKLVFSPTTTDISVGHAAHSSIPITTKCWVNEGLDIDVVGIQGSTAGVQQVSAKNVAFTTVGAEGVMMARAKGARIKAVYTYARSTIYRAVALRSSGNTKTEDLKGKTLGVIAMSTGAVPYGRQMLKAAKIDPDKDVQWLPIGEGGQAALALKRGDVAAWFAWDTAVAALKTQGIDFVDIKPPYHDALIGNVVAVHEDFLATHKQEIPKLLRCIAKATVFGLTNAEKTIKMHWQVYPNTKPTGDEAEAMKKSLLVYESRFAGYQVPPGVKWGENLASQWKETANLMKEENLLPADFDPSTSYTNEFIEEANKFDVKAIEDEARK